MAVDGPSDERPGWQRVQPEGHWDWSIPTPWTQGWRVGNMVFVGGQLSADEQGNVVEAGTVDALLRRVKEHFQREEHENVEVQKVVVQEVKTIQELTGEELRKS